MKKNILERAMKTAVEALLASLIPQIVIILSNIVDYDFANWKAWAIPLITSALATAISAGWNAWQNAKVQESEEK